MTPERVINAGSVDSEQRERDAEEIVHEERVVVVLWTAWERVVQSRQRHAYLEKEWQIISWLIVYTESSLVW